MLALAGQLGAGQSIAYAAACSVPSLSYPTIQSAVDDPVCNPINVAAGTYDEQVVINRALTLQGVGDTTVIRPSSAGQLTSLYTTGTQAGAFFNGMIIASIVDVRNVGAAGVTIRDLKVDGELVTTLPAGAQWVSGITFGETGGLIDNVTVEDTRNVSPASVRTYSIWLDAVGPTPVSVDVTDSTARFYGRNGINARGNSITVDIHNNTVVGPGTVGPDQVPNGILLIDGAGGRVTNNRISANHYTGVTFLGSGVLLFRAQDEILVSCNEIFDTDDAVLINATNLTQVQNNILRGNVKGVRIEAGGAANNEVTGNFIDDNSLYGIDLSNTVGAGNSASLNSIAGNVSFGVLNASAFSFDAAGNWWGDPSGPSGAGPGTGDAVSTDVDFTPWLTAAPLDRACIEGPPGDPSCSDGLDNDNDGLTDEADPDCQELAGPPEIDLPNLILTKACLTGDGDGDADFNVLVTQLEASVAADALDCGEVMVVADLEPGLYTIRELITGPDASNFVTAIVCTTDAGQTVTPGSMASVELEEGSDTSCSIVNAFQDPSDGTGGEEPPAPPAPPVVVVVPIDLDNTNDNALNNENLNDNNNENANTQEQSNEQEQTSDNNQTTTVNSAPSVVIDFD